MKKSYLLLLLALTAMAQKAPQVKIAQGVLEGVTETSGVNVYKGVPFAQPPVDNLRWKEPQPPAKWKKVYKATAFGNSPMQKRVFGDMNFRSPGMSEDCLYLNVWTPAKNADEKLPVLVYFYGGGFIAGDGSEYRYDGENLTKKGIVVVTVNYRLGIFGFFSHPELTKESPNSSSGNYGMLDQHAALLWVKNNIAAFGGNPDKITIGGESAGSISVSAHMASPLSKKLITGAIGQSGAMIKPTYEAIPINEAENNGVIFMEKSQISSFKKLRELPAEKLLEMDTLWGRARATIDGYFLQNPPVETFKEGSQAEVPLLTGWTSTELPYTAFMQGQYPSPENYRHLVEENFGSNADEILKFYPGNTEEEVIQSATELVSDRFMVYGTRKWALLHAQAKHPVYAYCFSKPRPDMKPELGDAKAGLAGGIIKGGKTEEPVMPKPVKGAAHASDIEYAFGNLYTNKVYEWDKDDYKASENMLNYFANFIKTGNPNGEGQYGWPVVRTDSELILMDINATSRERAEQNTERYKFLDKIYTEK
jgi:para-nitrobenzyl esterase